MYKILWIAILILFCSNIYSQTISAGLRGEITAFTQINDTIFDVTINVADESGVGNGTDVDSITWVMWQNCKRYEVQEVACDSCFLFNSEIRVLIYDAHGNGTPGFGFVGLQDETALGLGGFLSGILSSLQQCMLQYYVAQIELAINNIEPGDSLYQYTNGDAVIWADGPGITVTKNTTTGVWTIAIPALVRPQSINIDFANTDTEDSGSHIYLTFDYAGNRGYNTSVINVNVPQIRIIPTTGSPSTATPFNVTEGGNNTNDKAYGVSAYGGGDGSDLQVKIANAPVATSNTLFIDFAK